MRFISNGKQIIKTNYQKILRWVTCMDLTPWAYAYFIASTFFLVLAIHLYWRNWPYLGHYRLTCVISLLFWPYLLAMCALCYAEAARIWLGQPAGLISPGWVQRLFEFEMACYAVTFVVAIKLFGTGWVLRQKYAFNRQFGPYLIFGPNPATSMVILWGSAKPARPNQSQPTVLVGKDPKRLTPVAANIRRNNLVTSVELADLEPNTIYYYQVPPKREIFHFQTAPYLDLSNPKPLDFEFAILCDLHGSARPIKQTVNAIRALLPNIQFIVSGGDNVTDARIRRHWATLWGQMAPLSPFLPFESTPGNHDGELPPAAQNWLKAFPYPYPNPADGAYFQFTYLNMGFFMLDIYNGGKAMDQLSAAQLEWLRAELERLPPEVTQRVIILHKSIYTTGDFGCDKKLEDQLVPIIAEFHVKLVISGHSHLFEVFFRPEMT